MLATMSPAGTKYLQVPRTLPHRNARSRSKSRPRDVYTPQKISSPTEVIVSPIKLSFRHQSPPSTPVPRRTYRSPPPTPKSRDGTAARLSPRVADVILHIHDNDSTTHAAPVPTQPVSPALEDLHGDLYSTDPSMSLIPEPPLRQKLIGSWKLESYIAYPTPTSSPQRPTYPMTKNVTGFIMYTPDGYMAAQMLIPGQKSFKRGEGEEAQWAEAGKRCFAYCGPYYITNEGVAREEILRHTFQCCNLPGWVGDVQIRTHRFEEDGEVLVLGSETPTEIKGDQRIPVLKWRRARDNASGMPPPPTPKIEIHGPGEP